MSNKILIRMFIVLILLSIFIISFVNAWNWNEFKAKITGEASKWVDINISVAGGGNSPTIIKVFNNSQIGGALNEGSVNTTFIVNFTASDADGNTNLDSTKATINFTKTGEATRYNQTCKQYEANGNFANYTCEVQMWWWDGDGAWTINATINDLSAEKATNDTQTFSVALTTGFVLGPGNLTFTGVFGAATNITSNEVVILNNTGNKDIAQTAISINATKLAGETTASQALYSGNFSVGNTTGSSKECQITPSTFATQLNYTVPGGSFVNVTTAVMNASNYSINNFREGQEQLYFCLLLAGGELSQQSYSTRTNGAGTGTWTVQIV